MEYLTVSNIKLEVKRYQGNDTAPTLIFLHEGLGCVDMWRDFPERLSQSTGCPALIYSRQGYGRSDSCPLPRSLNYMHDEALEILPQVITAENIKDYILIGHSDGGSIAVIHAGGEHRKKLRAIITMAPHVFCEEISVQSIRQARQDFLTGKLRLNLQKHHHDNTDCAFWGWNDIWLNPDFIHWNIEAYLPNITVPQLILQGNDDHYGTVAQVHAMTQKSAGPVTVHMLPNCGHAPYREQTPQSIRLIEDFLRPFAAI